MQAWWQQQQAAAVAALPCLCLLPRRPPQLPWLRPRLVHMAQQQRWW